MRSIHRVLCIACCVMTAGVFTGCQTMRGQSIQMTRVTPGPGETLKVDQIMILADVTGSTSEYRVFEQEKNLLKAFVGAIPDLPYQMGFSSFAGGSQADWMQVPLSYGALDALKECAAHLKYLGGTTPLYQGVLVTGKEFERQAGRAALVVFSDGRTHPHERVLKACEAVAAAHDGELCIYTVNVGFSDSGKLLLEKMTRVTSCGHAWQESEVNTAAGMEAMIREIFFTAGPVVTMIEERTMVLPNEVLFDFDKSVLKPQGKAAVDNLIAEIKAHTLDHLVIEGHTCDIGSPQYNMDLSQRRADSVRAYMVEQGIDGSHITTEAYGLTRPAAPNTSEPNRKLNRRAEFRYSFRD